MNTRFIKHFTFVAAITVSALLALAAASDIAGDIAAQIPASTLTKPAVPEKAPDTDGFIQRWLLLEPIGANGLTDSAVQAVVKKEYFPDQLTVIPRDGDKVNIGGAELTWHAVDSLNYNVNLFHFARAQGKKTSDVLFWAVTIINCPREMRDVRLSIGSNAASVWWVNGKEVIGIYGDRQAVIDDGVSKRLTLNKGPNIVRAAIVNGGGATDFCARFLDAEDKPLKEITVSLGEVRRAPAPAKMRRQPQTSQRAGAAGRMPLAIATGITEADDRRKSWTADNGNGTFTNPLFYEEFSDPDMIRVGDYFYLTGTTMHSMPGLPILRSRDLVNWEFIAYAMDKLDLGPPFRLEEGKNIYGRGIWAPSFRYHNGAYYIFSNVNGQTTQMFKATNPAGPWTRTPMKGSFHDLSVLFDDDGKVYVVWGYEDIHFARLNDDLTNIAPGTERIIIAKGSGMGEGAHFYKIDGKYMIISAWWAGSMRMPAARADRPEGPYEINTAISIDEDFGLMKGKSLTRDNTPRPSSNRSGNGTTRRWMRSGRSPSDGGICDSTLCRPRVFGTPATRSPSAPSARSRRP